MAKKTLIQQVTPINLLEEKEKFFASNFTYNPQFGYEEEVGKDKLVKKYGLPTSSMIQDAKHVVDASFPEGKVESDLRKMKGRDLTQLEVETKLKTFLEMHNLEKRFEISWSHSFISRTTIGEKNIKLRLPVDFKEEGLIGMLYHEIGTHALRRINYEQQPWYKKKKTYGFGPYLETEEGLAILHSLLPTTNKHAYLQALRYLAVDVAQSHSFVELWNFLAQYFDDLERRWTATIRAKRGITDSSKPGGFTKDIVYFSGFKKVAEYLVKNNGNIEQLYFGKMSLTDVKKAVQLNPNFTPKLPSFYTVDTSAYMQKIKTIYQINFNKG